MVHGSNVLNKHEFYKSQDFTLNSLCFSLWLNCSFYCFFFFSYFGLILQPREQITKTNLVTLFKGGFSYNLKTPLNIQDTRHHLWNCIIIYKTDPIGATQQLLKDSEHHSASLNLMTYMWRAPYPITNPPSATEAAEKRCPTNRP